MGRVDKRTHRRMQGNTDDPANCQDGADRGLVPMGFRQQKNADVRAQPAAHVCQEKVQPVERPTVRHGSLSGEPASIICGT